MSNTNYLNSRIKQTTDQKSPSKSSQIYDWLYIDYEFNCTNHEKVNLVSCVTYDRRNNVTTKFWLHNDPLAVKRLVKHLSRYEHIFGWACVAECRSFYSAGLDPLKFKWMDGFLEYRMLTNHNDKLNYGWQLVDGKKKFFNKPKPKWERTEEDNQTGFKPTHSLAEATFKLTGQIRDTKQKDKTRNLIISNPKRFTEKEKKQILDYNADDVKFLAKIHDSIVLEYQSLNPKVDWPQYYEEAMWRGRYAAHTAIMESIGYPINYEATRNFSKRVNSIMAELQRDINAQFVDKFKAKFGTEKIEHYMPFKWNKSKSVFSQNQKLARIWIQTFVKDSDRWMKTDKGALSLSLEAWTKFFDYKHDYPRGNFGAQMVRFLKLKQSLYGFSERKKEKKKTLLTGGKKFKEKKIFWDSVGPDKRVRPYMNIFGAQSSRSQPAATGFMFLKPAWMRALVQPAKGYFLAGVDYGQQEFFLSALLSEDRSMIQAYLSGDPYLYMAKKAGLIPENGTKESHPTERDLMKGTTLGISYMMTKYGLSAKLTADTGREVSEDEAQELIDLFEEIYPDFTAWRQDIVDNYANFQTPIVLWDGWTTWADNTNPRSVGNVGTQGAGAVIMRKAVDGAVARGVKVIFTLHDAIYIEGKVGQEHHIAILIQEMRKAFEYYFEGTAYGHLASKIKMDPKAWGSHWPDPEVVEIKGKKREVYHEIEVGKAKYKVPVSKIHIDSRAKADYEKFSVYFNTPDSDLL